MNQFMRLITLLENLTIIKYNYFKIYLCKCINMNQAKIKNVGRNYKISL